MSLDSRFEVSSSFCEEVRIKPPYLDRTKKSEKNILNLHNEARIQSEEDFFGSSIFALFDHSHPKIIERGTINSEQIVSEINHINADLLICYGSSIIKSSLLETFKGRFLNVHLGLSPYYRGSGTNVWPLINREPQMIGATFMHIDAGIDSGRIIHQIQGDIYLGDNSHTIGNRLIIKMTENFGNIVAKFRELTFENQPKQKGKLYLVRDFDKTACENLYKNLSTGLIKTFLDSPKKSITPYLVKNKGLAQ